ncbi:MAG TPA: hypothetical protein VGR69_08020 [Candidatus Rubrimentiphilum sp.]|nr:hypothetical protein [Candidatus Rubrimentiphilum sp.]
MIIATSAGATSRLGRPATTVEYGTLDDRYVRRWLWICGCSGELIGSELIELVCCDRHRRSTLQTETA